MNEATEKALKKLGEVSELAVGSGWDAFIYICGELDRLERVEAGAAELEARNEALERALRRVGWSLNGSSNTETLAFVRGVLAQSPAPTIL